MLVSFGYQQGIGLPNGFCWRLITKVYKQVYKRCLSC